MAFNLQKVLQAMLFAANGPLTARDIQAALSRFHEQAQAAAARDSGTPGAAGGGDGAAAPAEEAAAEPAGPEDAELYADVPALVTTAQIREAMDAIAAGLRLRDEVFYLIEGANGYRLVTNPRYARWVRILRNEPPPVRLSQSAMETVAIIAYRQPVTRAEIEAIRGVSAEAGLNKLLERELIYVVGRADLPGRPLQYGTTDHFLEFIGIKSIDELPASDVLSTHQIDEWLQAGSREPEMSDEDVGMENEELPLDTAEEEVSQRDWRGDAAPGAAT